MNGKEGLVEKHTEGRYYLSHNGGWIDAGTDALEAQRERKQRLALDDYNRLSGKGFRQSAVVMPDSADRITPAAAAEKYFANCEARGLDAESIRKYRAAVDPFVEHCGVTYVDECRDNKQVLLDYMGWLRNQPVPVRKRSDGSCGNNPKRTLANRVSDIRIFLKSLGISKLLQKHEEPTFHKLRKTGASRKYLASIPQKTLVLELGHESLATTETYLADVRKPGEAKKAVADADFIPKPKVAKTGTEGD